MGVDATLLSGGSASWRVTECMPDERLVVVSDTAT